MTAVGELMLLVLGLMVTAHCEVRARDPEVEEEDQGLPVERGGWDTQGVGVHPGPGKFDIPHMRNGPHGRRPDIPGSAHHPVRHGPHGQPHQAGPGQHPLGLLPKETAPAPGEGGSYPARTG